MKTRNKIILFLSAVLVLLGLSALCALAQTNDPSITTPAGDTPKPALLLVIIPALVPTVIAIVKLIVPRIPSWSLPLLAPVLGAIADYISTQITGGGIEPVKGAVLGLAGVGLRELVDQMKSKQAPPAAVGLFLAFAILMTGCAAPKGVDIDPLTYIQNKATGTTFAVTSILLKRHQDWVDEYEIALKQLEVLSTVETIDVQAVLEIVNKLPSAALKGDTAEIIVIGTVLTFRDDLTVLAVRNPEQLRAAVKGMAEGLKLTLKSTPVPTTARTADST